MDDLPRLLRLFAIATGRQLTTVGRLVGGRADVMDRALTGTLTIARARRIIQTLSDRWPADLPWPPDIPRPRPSAAAASPSATAPQQKHSETKCLDAAALTPGRVLVPTREAVRRAMILERGLSRWARRRGYSPKLLQAVLSAYAGRAVDLDALRSHARHEILTDLIAFVGDGAALREIDKARASSLGASPSAVRVKNDVPAKLTRAADTAGGLRLATPEEGRARLEGRPLK